MRYALYFTPGPDDPLTLAAHTWLGRSAFTGDAIKPLVPVEFTAEEFSSLTREPRRYGLHATLVAPFRLRDGLAEADLLAVTATFVGQAAPFTIPGLALSEIGLFFALTPTKADGISALADTAVDHFDGLRAPLNEAEIARRRPELLSERQRLYLHRHGYPYVKEEFRFHMTLTGSIEALAAVRVEAALRDRFSPLLARPVEVSAVALFIEPAPGADFIVHSIHRLGATETRKYA
ncbi:DUF1045 domain-containing protein [Pseudaminobacter sp. NGMCC 1.201702]|uniref:DUF1045 domain-containing protein n=1 Tax=Pseudaminobacter sp. NGMCC 1.201702 TaxID=3391825 RepID=UPI0039EEAD93